MKKRAIKTNAEEDGCFSWNASNSDWERNITLNWRNPGYDQTEFHPVTCVSFHDAQEYVQWLSQRTGMLYRLPTEAEWEYAARARTTSVYSFGDNESRRTQCEFANGADQSVLGQSWWRDSYTAADCDDGAIYTAVVGRYTANKFGLYDMHGNLYEWTEDCWHQNYTKAPDNGEAWLESAGGDCELRVLRGGAWYFFPGDLRSAIRDRFSAGVAYYVVGFRVARTL